MKFAQGIAYCECCEANPGTGQCSPGQMRRCGCQRMPCHLRSTQRCLFCCTLKLFPVIVMIGWNAICDVNDNWREGIGIIRRALLNDLRSWLALHIGVQPTQGSIQIGNVPRSVFFWQRQEPSPLPSNSHSTVGRVYQRSTQHLVRLPFQYHT